MPNTNPIPNTGTVSYEYIVDNITQIPVQANGASNQVTTKVNAAIINNTDGTLSKSANKTYVDLGDTITYTIVIGNTGNTVATNVFFMDTIPEETTFVVNTVKQDGTLKPGVYPETGFVLANINPGTITTISFDVTVTSIPAVNPILNKAFLGYSYKNDPAGASIRAGYETNVVQDFVNRAVISGSTDGSLVKTLDKAFAKVGDTITYTVDVKNTGNVSANNLFIYDTIPGYTSFVSGSVIVNGIVSGTDNPQTGISLGSLSAGSTAQIKFKVTVTSIPPTSEIKNEAVAKYSYTVDPSLPNAKNSGGISNIVTTTIGTAVITGPPGTTGANNGGTKSANPNPANIGDTVVYSIAVYNAGNILASNVKVYDTTPTGSVFVPNSVKVDGVANPGETPETGMTVGNLAPKQTKTVTFSVVVNTLVNPGVLTNTARISFNFTTDPSVPGGEIGTGVTNPTSVPINTASFGNLNGQSGLTKTVSTAFATVGDTVTYTIDVKNLGNVTALGVVFEDTVPSGTQFIQDSLTIDGVAQNGAAPDTGVNLGNILASAMKQVQFKVKVLTIPNPNPFVNEALVKYNYNVSPTDNRLGADLSNKVKTTVNTAIIGEPLGPGQSGGSGVLKSADKQNADIGDTITYTLVVKNTGNVNAENVVVNDIIPVGTTFITDSVTIDSVSQPGVNPTNGIDLGIIAPNTAQTVTFKVLVVSVPAGGKIENKPSGSFEYTVDPSVPGGIKGTFGGNVVTIPANHAEISTISNGLIKSLDLEFATLGDTITYTIVLKNTGSVNATNVKVYDTVPNGTSYIANSILVNNLAQSASTPTTGINVGTLIPNGVATVIFKVLVTTVPSVNPIPNTADVAYNYNVDPSIVKSIRNTSNMVDTQMNYVDLGNTTKDGSPKYAKIGDIVTYTITIPNEGNTAVNNVVLKDTIPVGTTFVANSATVSGVQNSGNPEITGIQVGTINPNSSVTVTFKVLVVSIPPTNKLDNQARLGYSFTKDPANPDGVTGSELTNVNTVSITNAQIVGPPGTPGSGNGGTKQGNTKNAAIGDVVTYTITLLNSGNVPATNVVVKDTIPECTSLVNGSVLVNGTPSTDTPGTGINVGTINPGNTAIVKYSVKVMCLKTPPPAELVNTATVNYDFTTDPSLPKTTVTTGTNTSTIPVSTASFGKNNGQDGLVKSVDKAFADRGDTLTYTINLINTGNVTATNVVFKDTIPTDTSFVVNSVTVDGVAQSGVNPQNGVSLGSILAGGSKEVKFNVLVLTLPTPNPIPNDSRVSYNFTVDPSIPNGRSAEDISNAVQTKVNFAMIGGPTGPGTNTGSGIVKSSDKAYADIGDTVTYTFVVKNTGNVVAENVIVKDTIPEGSVFVNDSVTVNGTQMFGENIANGVNIGNINPNETKTVTFKTTVVSIPTTKNLVDTPSVNYGYKPDPNGPLTNVSGGGNTVTIPVNNANISTGSGGLNKSASPSFVTIGDTITYTVVMKNTGSVDALNVKVLDTLQNGVVFVPGSSKVNNVSKVDNPTTTGILVGTVMPNQIATVTFLAVVNTIPVPNPVSNTAKVIYDYKPSPNVVVTVTNPTNTTETQTNYAKIDNVAKDSDVNYVKVGDVVTYTITIPNTGNVDANNVVLKDTIPVGSTFVANSAKVNGSQVAGQDPQTGINVGTINAGSQAVVEFKVTVVSVPASGKLVNQARVQFTFTKDPQNPNGVSGNQISNVNTVSVTNAQIVGPPGTPGSSNNGTKSSDKTVVDIGDTVNYTITLLNSGNVPAFDVMVKDTIPNCTTLVNGSVKVNGNSTTDTPQPGIFVGTIPAGATATVKYAVKVTCLSTPPPAVLTNQADVSYKFTTDPSLPPTVVTGPTNPSTIPVTTAGFKINGQNGIVKSVDKAFATRGDVITYTIDLTNNGNTSANNIVFKDTIPNDTSYIQDSLSVDGVLINGASPQSGVSIGNILAGASKEIKFKVLVLTVPTPNPIPNTAIASYTYTVDPSLPNGRSNSDLSNMVSTDVKVATIGSPLKPGETGGSGVLKSADIQNADIGDTVTYTLVLKNTGNTVAKNVIVYDTIANGSTFIADSVTVDNVAVPGANPENGIDLGNIAANQTVTVKFKTLVVSIPSSKALTDTPRVDYSFTVDPANPDVNVTSGGNTVTIPVNHASISPTDGGFVKSQNPSYATVGDTITYTMIATNTGSVNADNVKVYDTLDSSLQFVNGSVKVNGTPQGASNPMTTGINVGTLIPNGVATITFNALVLTLPNPNPVKNQAVVQYTYKKDPNTVVSVTNPSNITTGEIKKVDLGTMVKDSDANYVKVGDVVTYTITIPNTGNADANNVVLKDTIPAGTTFVNNSAKVNGVGQPGSNPETTGINVGTINAGSQAIVEFKVTVVSVPASGKLTNQARANYTFTVDPSVPDGRTGSKNSNVNVTTVTNAQIVGPPGTAGASNNGTKSADKTVVDIGDTVNYTITLLNSGNVPAFDVMVKDTIPNCTTLVNGSVKVNGNATTDTPQPGIFVGTIPAGQTAIVKYAVKVTCLSTPPPAVLTNKADISYKFTTDPSLPPTVVTGPTNPSTIPVVTAGFNINGQNGIIKSVDKAFADRGSTVTYTVSLTNNGNTTANNVMFIDTIPNDTSYIQNSLTVNGNPINGANPNGGVSLGSIAANETVIVSFIVQVLTVPNPNPMLNAALVNYNYTVNPSIPDIRTGKDLSNTVKTTVNNAMIGFPGAPGSNTGSGVLKTATPANADIGTTVTYTLSLTNTGNTVAKNVIVSDTVPVGSTFIPNTVKVNGSVVPGADPNLGIDLGNINAGQTVTVIFQTMTVSIPPSKSLVDTPKVTYSYTVDPSIPDTNVTGGGNTVTIPVNHASISPTDGGFVKLQDPSFVTVGDTVTYTMIAKNTGSVPANNVKVTDTLDPSLQFVTGSVKVNNVSNASANPNTGITVGTLNPNAIATITFNAKVITVPNPNPILNQAKVSYNYNVDPNTVVTTSNPSNVTSGKVNYVDMSKMSKSGNPSYVKLGDVLTYTITVPNNGNVDANNVLVKDTIPQGTSFLANSVYVNGIQQGSVDPQVTGINVGTITPNSEAIVKFSVTVNSVPQSGIIENTATSSYTYTVDPSVPDGRTGTGSSNKETTTVTNASLVGPPGTEGATNAGTKSGSTKNADIGDTVTYTITMFNSGNVAAINTVIHDTIPNCTTLVNGSVTVNGNPTTGTPGSGITVGTIPAGGTAVVKYSVKVTCLSTPPPANLKNQATIDYGFITDPTKPPTTVTGVTNLTTIPVTTAGFNINGQNGIVKEVSKAFADRGDILTYTITLTNLGNTSANNVMFVDTIPNDTSYVQDSLTVNGNAINGANPNTGVSLGNIGALGTVKVVFKVQVLTVPNPNPLANAALASYSYTVNPSIPNGKSNSNLSNTVNTRVNNAMIGYPGEPGTTGGSGVLKTATPANADIGTTVTYTLSLTNTGNTQAKNVIVSDTVPVGSTLIPNTVKVNGVVVPGANPNLGIDLGNIGPNQTVTVIYQAMTVSIPASKALIDTPVVTYSYTVDPSIPDTNVTGGGNTVTIPVNHASISPTDGGFVKSQDPSYATIGDIITYTMVAKNTGSVEATNVTITDTLASSVSFISNSVTINGVVQGSLASPVSGIVIGTIAPNDVYTVTFKVKVVTVPNPNPILNQAKVTYSYKPDPNTVVTTSNPSNVTTGKINYVDISKMSKSGNPAYVKLGDVLTYTITIPNNGNVDATNVLLKDTIPNGTSFVNNSVFINGINQGGMNPENPGIQVGTINANTSAIVKFSVTVNSIPASGILENTATSSYTYTVDPSVPDGRVGTGNSNKETTTVTNAKLVGPPGTAGENNSGTKVGTPTNVDIGDTVNYSITLFNSGNVPAINTMVYDTIPTCTSLVNGSVKVNGIATTDIPGTGIRVGTIPAGQTVVVNYAVKVTCLKTPPPATLTNTATINYQFITDPSKPPTTVTGVTNTSTIPVTTAGFNINGQNGMVKTATPDFVDVGDTVTFTIAMTNLGNTTANDVVLIDTIPNGTEFNQGSVVVNGVTNGTANPNGGINLGNIPAGNTVTIKFTVKVLDIPTPNPILNQATASFTYTVNPSIPNGRVGQNNSNTTSTKVNNALIGNRVTPGSPNGSGVFKVADPTIADIGDTITYTFVITNNGNVIAQNVVLTDSMSDGSVFVSGSVTVNGASRPSDNPSSGINLGNVGVGVTDTITFKAKVVSLPNGNAVVDTPIINYSYKVDPNGPNKNVTGGGTTVTVPVNVAIISSKDGGITKNANPSYVTVGDTITYTITVKNTGSIEANSVMVYDTLQNGVVFVPGTVKANGLTFPSADPTVGIALGTVYVNQIVTVTFDALVNTVPNPNPISNTANVGYTYKPTPDKVVTVTNPSPTTTTPVNYVDLSKMKKTSDPSYVERGDTITYTIVIPNNGNTAANNVMVSDSLPFGVTFIPNSVFVNGVNQTGVDPEITGINVGSILPGSSATVTFKALVVTIPSTGLLKNRAKASYVYTVDPSKPNCREGSVFSNINTVTVTDANLIAPPSVPCSKHNGQIKYADKEVMGIGDIVTYTVQVYNDGNIPATNVVVNDTIVNCGEFVPGSVIVNGISMPTQTVSGGITIGVINPKETGYIMYKVKVKCLPPNGKLINTANINYSFIKDPANPPKEEVTTSNTVTIPVLVAGFGVKDCKNGVVKSVDKTDATVGELITYTVSMCNGGNVPALNVKFIDTIPQGTSFVEDSFSLNEVIIPNANPEGGVNLGTINALTTATVSFKVKVISIPNPNPILNNAIVKYDYVVDPSLPNRTGSDMSNSVSTRIKYAVIGNQLVPGNPSGSGLIKLADKNTVDIGDVVTFSLVAKNTGNVDAENVVIFDTLPNSVSFIANSVFVNGVPQLSSSPVTGIDIGNVSPGMASTVTFKATVVSIPEGGKIINSGFVDYSYTVDPALPSGVIAQALGNTITIPVNTAVISVVKDGLVKKVDVAYAKLGEVVTYTIFLTNKGTVNATTARVYDTIPNGASFITGSVTVDGIAQSSNPQTGILVGTVKPFETRVVSFKVIVTSVPNINPMPNLCDVVYSYDTEGGI
ncbi:MAG: DUF7507 domain-containing protein [Clostridium sp.]|uniref:DUF7507 domain-containing protein n=1 Tax=Clostridium sp. TaxID=1506 RepID=UPI003F2D30BB